MDTFEEVSGWLQVAFQIGLMVLAWMIARMFSGVPQWTMIWVAFGVGFGAMLISRLIVPVLNWGYTYSWIIFTHLYISPLLSTIGLYIGMHLLYRAFSRSPLRTAPTELPDPAGINMDESGMVTAWDTYAEAMFGWSVSEAVGQPLTALIIPLRLQQRHRDGVAAYLRERDQRPLSVKYQVTAHHRDGSEFDVVVRISVLPQPDGSMQFAGTINRLAY